MDPLIKSQLLYQLSYAPNLALLHCLGWIGGRTRTRTLDPLIKSQLLYQLSYAPNPSSAFAKPAVTFVVARRAV